MIYDGAYPVFNIKIGPVDFQRDGLLQYVKAMRLSKNADKTSTIGKKRVKANNCDITLLNPNGVLDNILRWGRKIEIWIGHKDQYLVRTGVYRLMQPTWNYPESGVPEIKYRGEGGEVKMMFKRTAQAFQNAKPSTVIRQLAEAAGLQVSMDDTAAHWEVERYTIVSGGERNDWETVNDLAFKLGKDVWVDDSTDPNTLCVRDLTSTMGDDDQLTVSWGPTQESAFRALSVTIDHRYPQPVPFGGVVPKSKAAIMGTAAEAPNANGSSVATFRTKTNVPTNEPDAVSQRQRALASPTLASLMQSLGNASKANTLVKSATARFAPLIPFFRLGQVVTFLGLGDQSGKYRIIDITHEFSFAGAFTTIKAVKGGTAKKPAEKPAEKPTITATAAAAPQANGNNPGVATWKTTVNLPQTGRGN